MVAGVAVEGRPQVERVGHGHDFMDDHGVPVLSGKEAVLPPVKGEVGVAQTQIVDCGIGAAGKVTFYKG